VINELDIETKDAPVRKRPVVNNQYIRNCANKKIPRVAVPFDRDFLGTDIEEDY
jgi:hypothetical protein